MGKESEFTCEIRHNLLRVLIKEKNRKKEQNLTGKVIDTFIAKTQKCFLRNRAWLISNHLLTLCNFQIRFDSMKEMKNF